MHRARLLFAVVAVTFSLPVCVASRRSLAATADGRPADAGKNRTRHKRRAGVSPARKAAAVRRSRRSKTARASHPRSPQTLVASTGGVHTMNDVQVTPFPSHAAAAAAALSQNRRDQLNDAERAARAAQQEDRWNTVLFHLREMDGRSDAEACFWRVIAYYRLGQMARAKSIRANCDLAGREQAALDAEYALAASVQPAAALPEMLAAGERPPAPVENTAPYAGDGPSHLER